MGAPKVDFYTLGEPDRRARLITACRLAEKAYEQGLRVVVRTASAAETAEFDELLWTVAVARLIFGDTLSVQAPPNLQEPGYGRLIEAGIDDWGGVSPVTIDHVNPEAPWPEIERLRAANESRGLALAPRLPLRPQAAGRSLWCFVVPRSPAE